MVLEKISQAIKAAVAATVISVIFAFVLAVVQYFVPMRATLLIILSQTLKALSLALACLLFLRGEAGIWKGILAGVTFTLLSFLCFNAIGGGLALSWLILLDFALGIGVGAFAGIAAANIRPE